MAEKDQVTTYTIAFIDLEIDPKTKKILDIGSVKGNGNSFHKSSPLEFIQFLNGTDYLCGHNVYNHDLKYISEVVSTAGINLVNVIDTLPLSPLLFPTNPYHALLKDDKLQSEELNNPLNDSIKAKDLFYDEVAAFKQLNETLKQIFYLLLRDKKEFAAFFRFLGYTNPAISAETLVRQQFRNEICEHADIAKIINEHPVELAYCLSLTDSFIRNNKVHSITPPWVLKN